MADMSSKHLASPGTLARDPHAAAAVPGGVVARRLRLGRRPQGSAMSWVVPMLFVLPVAIYMLVFFAYPLVFGVIMSFEKFGFSALIKGHGPFTGLANYNGAFAAGGMLRAIINTAVFTVLSLVFQFAIGLGLAILFNKKFVLSGILRGLVLLPWLLPLLASGTLFELVFAGNNGLINRILLEIGIIHHPIYWFVHPLTAFAAVTLVNIWAGIPFNTLVLYSGLQDVPGELYEAASMDGAGPMQRFLHVTIPSLRDVILIVIMLGIIYTVKTFDIVVVMTDGGPGNATQLLSTWAYNAAFQQFNFGQGTAIGNVLLVFCLIVGVFYVRMSRRSINA